MALTAAQQQQAAAAGIRTAASNLAGGFSAAGSWIARNGSGQNAVNSAMSENDASGMISAIRDNVMYNNQYSASQAAELRRWQEQQTQRAMEFNAAEAAKNRAWQEMMSNTAHQREIADLKAAGLNPVLSAMGGNGAAVTSGATASASAPSGAKGDADTSANSALVSLLGSMLSAQTTLESQRLTAENNMAIAERNNATKELVAMITGEYGLKQADIHGRYGVQQAGISASAVRDAAATNAAASIYGSDTSRKNSLTSAYASMYGADKSYQAQRDFPNGFAGVIDRALRGEGGLGKTPAIKGLNALNNATLGNFIKLFGIE